MKLKNRITKLEGKRRGGVEVSTFKFTQEFRADGDNLLFIDGVQVDAETYAKQIAEYARVHKDSRIPFEKIVYPNGIPSSKSLLVFAA
ncbi:MAG: hypothetical protein IPM31_16950 [Anaerolineae bacterium]|nr:hypothetical protein [Anaerolineae bacterium]